MTEGVHVSLDEARDTVDNTMQCLCILGHVWFAAAKFSLEEYYYFGVLNKRNFKVLLFFTSRPSDET
jgi:hypothetical protein